MNFNINNEIKVKLNESGRKYYLDYLNKLGLSNRQLPKEDDAGYSTWQTWDFMRIFGNAFNPCVNGSPIDTNIEIIIQ